jgi:hypothetical protein
MNPSGPGDVDVDFFRRSLKEEGLTQAKVTHHSDPTGGEVIRVTKTIDGEKAGVKHSLTSRQLSQIDSIKKHLAMLARQTATQLEDYFTEEHEWGENCVRLDIREDFTAECYRCGSKVSIENLHKRAAPLAETAVPHPVTSEKQTFSDNEIRMALLGLLKDECETFCPNSPVNRKF